MRSPPTATMDRIAADPGLGTAVNLRHHFHRVLGVTPAAHRAAFRSTTARRAS
ncbi:hypothetical protein [Nocardia uniformis]|uniref:hypothetical protein n=1 Tax=Nocardia uniformis TaxID=53432 RepID=UPI000AEC3E4C|nr:hypothetical protein [Nocardia uniformis]